MDAESRFVSQEEFREFRLRLYQVLRTAIHLWVLEQEPATVRAPKEESQGLRECLKQLRAELDQFQF